MSKRYNRIDSKTELKEVKQVYYVAEFENDHHYEDGEIECSSDLDSIIGTSLNELSAMIDKEYIKPDNNDNDNCISWSNFGDTVMSCIVYKKEIVHTWKHETEVTYKRTKTTTTEDFSDKYANEVFRQLNKKGE